MSFSYIHFFPSELAILLSINLRSLGFPPLSLDDSWAILYFLSHRAATDHNVDNTTEILREWLKNVQRFYHYVEWRPMDEPEWVARQHFVNFIYPTSLNYFSSHSGVRSWRHISLLGLFLYLGSYKDLPFLPLTALHILLQPPAKFRHSLVHK